MSADDSIEVPPEYGAPEGLRTLANYLRSQNGVKVRSGIQHEKRVDYFKGKRLVEAMLDGKKWPKTIPKITDKGVAIEVANLLLKAQFFHRSEKVEGKKGYLKVSKNQAFFEEIGHYTWIFTGNMTWSNIGTGAVIAVVIGFTLLPIWPDIAKRILWYFSVTFLIVTLAFVLVRFLIFLVFWLVGYEFWIFPRLFDETLSMQDSFKPFYSFEKGATGQGLYRVGMIAVLVGFVYWACTQPTEFDGFLKANRDFLDDLYSGNLLTDVAQDHKDNIDRIHNVPKLEDLLKQMEDEETNGGSNNSNRFDIKDESPEDSEMDQSAFDDQMLDELLSRQETEVENSEF